MQNSNQSAYKSNFTMQSSEEDNEIYNDYDANVHDDDDDAGYRYEYEFGSFNSGTMSSSSCGSTDGSLTASTISLLGQHQNQRQQEQRQSQLDASRVAVGKSAMSEHHHHQQIREQHPPKSKLLFPGAPKRQFHHYNLHNRIVAITPMTQTQLSTPTPVPTSLLTATTLMLNGIGNIRGTTNITRDLSKHSFCYEPNAPLIIITTTTTPTTTTTTTVSTTTGPMSTMTMTGSVINQARSVRCIRRPPLWPHQQHHRQQQHDQDQEQNQYQNRKQQQHQFMTQQEPPCKNNNSKNNKNEKSFEQTATTSSVSSSLTRWLKLNDSITNALTKLRRHTACFKLKANSFMLEFLQGSSIHGIIYLAKIGLSLAERMLWFAFICVALFSIISLSKRTWQRFQTSPMVISMDRNKLVWNTSFPSLTVCPHKRIDDLKVDEYMIDHPEHFQTEEDKENFHDFIVKLASLSFDNLEILPLNNSFGIPSHKYLDILYELKWHFEPEISSGAAVNMFIYETQTEFGICHSVNSLVARYNSYDYWKQNDWSLLEHGDRVTVHPLDGEIYAQIINLSTAYDVYFHGPGDIPNISKQRYTFPESDYTTVELIALEIYTNEEAKGFTTKQRKCRFPYEAEEMLTVPVYSFGFCLSECRMFFALKVCGCVPHFYRNILRNGRVLPVCGLEGIGCLAKIKREIISLKSDKYKVNCNCLANCDDSNFFVQSYRSRLWFLGANLQWGIIDYPKMQLRRDVLFSFADVLVYIGGLIGFFLGCSALSFTEIIYYFTCRFVKHFILD